MKFFIVALAVILIIGTASAGPPEDPKVKADGIVKDCAKQLGITPDVVDKFRAGDWVDREAEAKNLSKCIFTKNGFIDDTGKLNEAAMIEKIGAGIGDKQKAEELVKGCKGKDNVPQDDIPLNFYKCYLEAKAM